MRHFTFFRRKLAHRLRACAVARRRACAGDLSGADLAVVRLFDRLARDAEQLPQAMVDAVAQLCADPVFARRFEETWEALPEAIGLRVSPVSAGQLVRWMVDQARRDAA